MKRIDLANCKFQEIGEVKSAKECQWYCSEIYNPTCTWFLYDKTTKDCKIFFGAEESLYDDCNEFGFTKYPSLSDCLPPFDSSNDKFCNVSYQRRYEWLWW